MVTMLRSGQTCSLKSKVVSFEKGTRQSNASCALYFESLPETCIPSWESFEPMMTKYAQDKICSIKLNQRKELKMEQDRVTVIVLCTSSHCQKHAYKVQSHLNADAATTADESNPYTSHSQATPKVLKTTWCVHCLVQYKYIHL